MSSISTFIAARDDALRAQAAALSAVSCLINQIGATDSPPSLLDVVGFTHELGARLEAFMGNRPMVFHHLMGAVNKVTAGEDSKLQDALDLAKAVQSEIVQAGVNCGLRDSC